MVEWTGPPEAEAPASVIEVVSGGSEDPESSPKPSGGRASRKAGVEAEALADTGGTNPAGYVVVGLAPSALLARRILG